MIQPQPWQQAALDEIGAESAPVPLWEADAPFCQLCAQWGDCSRFAILEPPMPDSRDKSSYPPPAPTLTGRVADAYESTRVCGGKFFHELSQEERERLIALGAAFERKSRENLRALLQRIESVIDEEDSSE